VPPFFFQLGGIEPFIQAKQIFFQINRLESFR